MSDYTTHAKRVAAVDAKIIADVRDSMVTLLGGEGHLKNAIHDFCTIVWQDDSTKLNNYVTQATSSHMMNFVCGMVMVMNPKSKFNRNYGGKDEVQGSHEGDGRNGMETGQS